MKYNSKIIKIILLLQFIIILTLQVQAMPDSEIERILNQVEPQIHQQQPTFTEILATVYFTPVITQDSSWCSPTRGSCFESSQQILEFYNYESSRVTCIDRSAGFCCIYEKDRGVYEEIKCQGSGVYEECENDICETVIYHTSKIKTTKEASQPQQGYQYGITSTELDPKPKWTVAVNSKEKTSCYIRYGTLMYVYFKEGNPWNGIYRAEDTGSAFLGECKMDFYAGIGTDSVKEAAIHVSGKTPKVYILTSPIPPPPSTLSKTALAENYNFVTREEYASIHGSETITATYVPQRISNIQTGEITQLYTSTTIIKNIKNFYETIKEFSNEVLKDCSNIPYELRTACAYNKAKEYEQKNITINHCSQNTYAPIHNTFLNQNQIVNISGILTELEFEENTNITITLQQLRGEKIKIKMPRSVASLIIEHPTTINHHIKLYDINITNITNEIIEVEEIKLEQVNITEKNESWIPQENMKIIALDLFDCEQNTQECLCETKIIQTENEIKIQEKNISAQNHDDIKMNFFLSGQDISINSKISSKLDMSQVTNPLPFINPQWIDTGAIIKNESNTLFKIEPHNKRIIYVEQNNEPSLELCKPQEKHVIFCAQPVTEGKSYFERTFYPKMNFALKI